MALLLSLEIERNQGGATDEQLVHVFLSLTKKVCCFRETGRRLMRTTSENDVNAARGGLGRGTT